jgi:hypothetical protein
LIKNVRRIPTDWHGICTVIAQEVAMRRRITEKTLELLNWHRENGVIEVRKLPAGTRIALDTISEHYELEVGTPKKGVVLLASDRRFDGREKAIVTGSTDLDTGIFLPRIIGEGLTTVLRRPGKTVVRTDPVLAAVVRGKGDSYVYNVWD